MEAFIAQECKLLLAQVTATVRLLNGGASVAFIARYRQEETGLSQPDSVRRIRDLMQHFKLVEAKREAALKKLSTAGTVPPQATAALLAAQSVEEVAEALTVHYHPTKKMVESARKAAMTLADRGRAMGLSNAVVERILQADDRCTEVSVLRPEHVVDRTLSIEDYRNGATHILAEHFADQPALLQMIQDAFLQFGRLVVHFKKTANRNDISTPLRQPAPHVVMAANRFESEKLANIALELNDHHLSSLLRALKSKCIPTSTCIGERRWAKHLAEKALDDAYTRLMLPRTFRRIRKVLTENARRASLQCFATNLKQLLMVRPYHQSILGWDPGFKNGCKLAVINAQGDLLDAVTVFPFAPQCQTAQSEVIVKGLVTKNHVTAIALGDGTASRESASFISGMIKRRVIPENCLYTVVSEAGASIYSASKTADEEMPTISVATRGALSIARRLLDPLSELVKIEPRHLGIGMYQHDMPEAMMNSSLEEIVMDCVNEVGVDLNSASEHLLRFTSGLTAARAKAIVDYRKENGPFVKRSDIGKVKGIGPKTVEQCAGFLRCFSSAVDGFSLENTRIHPESYKVAEKLCMHAGICLEDGGTAGAKSAFAPYYQVSREPITMAPCFPSLHGNGYILATPLLVQYCEANKLGVNTALLIIEELIDPYQDPRLARSSPVFRNDVLTMNDIDIGMQLNGRVVTSTSFGVFVDVGVCKEGLLHVSEVSKAGRSLQEFGPGQSVSVYAQSVDVTSDRLGLSLFPLPATKKRKREREGDEDDDEQ